MKRIGILISIVVSISANISAQGLNNNHKIDSKDLVNLFEAQGIQVFKFPFVTKRGEYISVSYEVYEMGKKINERRLIEDALSDRGITINHHISRRYSKKWHRFYMLERNDSLTIRVVLPGIGVTEKEDISKIETLAFNSNRTPKRINKKRLVMWAYGNIRGSERSKSMNGIVTCSTGLEGSQIIENYDFIILFYAERIKRKNKSD